MTRGGIFYSVLQPAKITIVREGMNDADRQPQHPVPHSSYRSNISYHTAHMTETSHTIQRTARTTGTSHTTQLTAHTTGTSHTTQLIS
ncbi:hypothetical protein CEXT_91471 [Caerostris extrusa]|uniref:Uncharacterized protein n=1 Tax=Caerostris extrusa TaxID=172846 RepID=A0AAV4XBL4_CAEEX|nr:hypothetical protein CEXT_91471 [Caerostris extrusa]